MDGPFVQDRNPSTRLRDAHLHLNVRGGEGIFANEVLRAEDWG